MAMSDEMIKAQIYNRRDRERGFVWQWIKKNRKILNDARNNPKKLTLIFMKFTNDFKVEFPYTQKILYTNEGDFK